MRPSCFFRPRGCIDHHYFSISACEISLKPYGQAVCLERIFSHMFESNIFGDLIYFFVADRVQIKLKQLRNLGDNKSGVYYLNTRFLLHPFLHLPHIHPINLIPILNLLIFLILIPNQRALVSQPVRNHVPTILVQVGIPRFDHSVDHAIIE